MERIGGKGDKPKTFNWFSSNISFFIQGRTASRTEYYN